MVALAERTSGERWKPAVTLLWALLFFIGFGLFAARLSTDGTPDFRIYHYYNGFAVHHDRSKLDIDPAEEQTYLYNGVDGVYYSLFRALNSHTFMLNFSLSIPYSAAAFLIFLISRVFFPKDFFLRDVACAGVAVLGLTGAGALPTIATTMSDIVPGVPFLIALTAWLYLERSHRNSVRTSLLLGAIAGCSVALKLTTGPLFIGLFLVIALHQILGRKPGVGQAAAFAIGGFIVFVAIDAHWLATNYAAFGDPLFPLMNNIFQSDYIDHGAWTDDRFMPKTVMMALFYPAYWAFAPSHVAIELDMRDPRILLGATSALAVVALFIVRRLRGEAAAVNKVELLGLYLAGIFLISYILWEKVWSIYRYLSILETLSGVMVVVLLTSIARGRARSIWVFALLMSVAGATMASTEYPWWSRAQRGGQAVSIKLPPLEANAMVITLDPYAYSYLVPAMPRTVRVIGANTNLIRPGSWGKLESLVESTIHEHHGPLWGLEYPEAFPGSADGILKFYQLERDGACTQIETNLEEKPVVRMCRLKRGS